MKQITIFGYLKEQHPFPCHFMYLLINYSIAEVLSVKIAFRFLFKNLQNVKLQRVIHAVFPSMSSSHVLLL
jgi:hypothetical protein